MKTECSPGPRIHAQKPNIVLLNLFQLRRGKKNSSFFTPKKPIDPHILLTYFLKLRVRTHEAIMKIKCCSLKKIQNNFNFTLLIEDEIKYQWLVCFWLRLVIDFDKTEPTLTLENYCINFISPHCLLICNGMFWYFYASVRFEQLPDFFGSRMITVSEQNQAK